MPLPVSNSASPGFLRDINFSALVDGFLRKQFGEVERPPWMKFTIASTREVVEMQTVFVLTVAIDPQRNVDLGTGTGLRVGPQRRKRQFQVPFKVPDSVVAEFREELPDMFTAWLGKAIKENAFRFYELDPRIGWRAENDGDELPESPLFDPPGPFSRTGEREYKGGETVDEPRCPFCREPHEDGSHPLWGGANLMWVHHHCWRGS